MARSTGKVRAARLTDLAALGELSRLAQADGEGTRSLGLPVTGPRIGVFSLFRLPLGAFSPNDVLYVYDATATSPACSASSATARATSGRSSSSTRSATWTRATSASGSSSTCCATAASAARSGSTWPAADVDDNVELFMQAGFIRFGDEHVLFREPEDPLPAPLPEEEARAARIRPPARSTRCPSRASTRRSPRRRSSASRRYGITDWERQGRDWRVPRSSLAPILRFADVDAFVQESEDGGKDGTQLDAFVQIGVAKEDQPHYLKVMARPGGAGRAADPLRARRDRGARRRLDAHRQGVLAPVRTYESPIDRRLEEEGFASIATVTLLMKETLVRVAEPRLVPAGVR